jgi:hypothetical protein
MNKHFADLAADDCPAEIPRFKGDAVLAGAWAYPATGDTPSLLKVRFDSPDGKTMLWYRGSAGDCWESGLDGHAPPLYGVASIKPGKPLLLVEGEKAAAALHSLGLAAVGLPGAGSAASVHLGPLNGMTVALWADNDEAGRKAMDTLAARLGRAHRRVNPALLAVPPKGDAADLVSAGMDAPTLRARLNAALVDVAGPVPPEPMGQHLPDDWMTTDIPPREFVFKGALPLDVVSLLVATGGTGKSMLSLELAVSAATGRGLLAGFEPTAEPCRVAVLALEDDQQEIHRRLKRIGAAFNLAFDDRDPLAVARNVRLFCLPSFAVCAADEDTNMLAASDDLKRLSAELADFKPRLVIADPLAGLLGGVVEEGSNEAAQAIIGMLRSAIPPGAAMLVCAHTSKAERMVSTTARGASAWMDAARQVLALRPPDVTETRTLGDDALRTVVLQMTKSNYSALTAPMYLQRCALPEFAGVLKPFDMADCQSRAALARVESIAAAMLATLAEYPVTKQEVKGDIRGDGEAADGARQRHADFLEALTRHVGREVSRPNRLECIDAMLADGRIVKRKDGKRDVLVPNATPETDEDDVL